MPLNMNVRTVACLVCRYDVDTAEPVPVCPGCGANLITVVYSAKGPSTQPRHRITAGPWETR